MRSKKLINIILLLAVLISFGGGEFLHSHSENINFDTKIQVIADSDHSHDIIHAAKCSSCTFTHAFKTTGEAGSYSPIRSNTFNEFYTYEYTSVINPYLHENTGLSPPSSL
jgi:hypothetical protein